MPRQPLKLRLGRYEARQGRSFGDKTLYYFNAKTWKFERVEFRKKKK